MEAGGKLGNHHDVADLDAGEFFELNLVVAEGGKDGAAEGPFAVVRALASLKSLGDGDSKLGLCCRRNLRRVVVIFLSEFSFRSS